MVPPSPGLDEALLDLRTLDVMRPLLQRLKQMTELPRNSEMALGRDMMETAMEGYAPLKVSGKNRGLDSLVPAAPACRPAPATTAGADADAGADVGLTAP